MRDRQVASCRYSALLSGRNDVIVISSVSCIYGMGNPADFYNNVIEIKKGKLLDRNVFLRRLVDSLYVRNDIELNLEETSVLKVILLTSHWLIPIIYSVSYFGMMKSMRSKK